jgi:hypothetical protein
VITDLGLIESASKCKGLETIIRVGAQGFSKLPAKSKYRRAITLVLYNANEISNGIRKHWGIENKVHWILDVAFNEDLGRKRTGNAAKNFTSINRIEINMLRADNRKASIVRKRLAAGWDNDYMLKPLKI